MKPKEPNRPEMNPEEHSGGCGRESRGHHFPHGRMKPSRMGRMPGMWRMPHRFSGHPGPMPWMAHDFDFYLSLSKELSLSEEQVSKLQAIASNRDKNRILTFARLQVAELELRELLHKPTSNREEVDAKIKEIGGIKTELHMNDIHAILDAREVLTEEQKSELEELRPFPFGCWF